MTTTKARRTLNRDLRWVVPPPPGGDGQGGSGIGTAGICFSGGGIRSAAFSLGALQRLEEGDPDRGSVLSWARYLAGVSGGGYLAGAAQLLASRTGTIPFQAGSEEEDHLRRHASYLADTAGEWIAALTELVVKLLANLLFLAALIWVSAQPLGWMGRQLLGPQGRLHGKKWPDVPVEVAIAVAILGGSAIMLAAGCRRYSVPTHGRRRAGSCRLPGSLAIGLGTAAAVMGITGIALPLIDGLGFHLVQATNTPHGVKVAAGSWPAALVVILLGRLSSKALGRKKGGRVEGGPGRQRPKAKGRLPFAKSPVELLAGPVLGLVVVGYLTFFAAQARAAGPNSIVSLGLFDVWRWVLALGVAVALTTVGLRVDAVNWSMHRTYKRRLWSAFACDPERHGERAWGEPTKLSVDGARVDGWPQLLLCGAAQVSGPGLAPPGRRAVTWTFDSDWVGGPEIGWCPTGLMERAMADRGQEGDVSMFGAMAISGAAFGSAMGRQSKGSVDALLALANARLGVWLPNPAQVACDDWKGGRRNLGYVAREVFGRFPSDAPWILVSDGGHFENLGLLELFRRRCSHILCFDASGAAGGAPTTVAEALRLAEEDLGVVVDLADPWGSAPGSSPVRLPTQRLADALDRRLAQTSVLTGTVRYPAASGLAEEARLGSLIVGRAVLDPETPWPLLSYASGNPVFPNDPTTDQWFDHDQFANYRLLGRTVATRVIKAMDDEHWPWWNELDLPDEEASPLGARPEARPRHSAQCQEAPMDERDELTIELAKSALEVISPEEVPLLDAIGPDLLLGVGQAAHGDGALGFGGLDVMTSTTMALLSSKAVVKVLTEIAQKFAVDQGVGLLKRLVDRLKGGPAHADPIKLSEEELALTRTVALEQAVGAGVDPARAALIADAIVGRLAVSL